MKLTTLCYLQRDDEILMLYRNKKKEDANEGKWIGIGGRIEEGEAPDECMIREVREETALEVCSYECLGVITFVSDRWEDEYMFLYRVGSFAGEMTRDCPEGTLKWIRKEEVMQLPLWEGDRYFLSDLISGKKDIRMKLIYEGEKLVKAVRFGTAGEEQP